MSLLQTIIQNKELISLISSIIAGSGITIWLNKWLKRRLIGGPEDTTDHKLNIISEGIKDITLTVDDLTRKVNNIDVQVKILADPVQKWVEADLEEKNIRNEYYDIIKFVMLNVQGSIVKNEIKRSIESFRDKTFECEHDLEISGKSHSSLSSEDTQVLVISIETSFNEILGHISMVLMTPNCTILNDILSEIRKRFLKLKNDIFRMFTDSKNNKIPRFHRYILEFINDSVNIVLYYMQQKDS
jgi:hypothetical protein